MTSEIHPPDVAIDHMIDTLTDRFPEDRRTVAEIVHRIYGEISESARVDTHLVSLTQHQAAGELRERQRVQASN